MWSEVLRLGLIHGGVLSALMGAFIAASLRHDPMIWVKSSPRDVQAFAGPPSARTLRRKRGWGVAMLLILIGVFGHLVRDVCALAADHFPALEVAVAALLTFQCFNLFDALVIDVGLVLFKPRWAFVEGTADLPGLRDVRWHVVNYVKGLLGGFGFAAVVTLLGLAWFALT